MKLEKLKKNIDYKNDKVFFSKTILAFLNIWLFTQFSPTYEKLWTKSQIPDTVPPIFAGEKYSPYKNNTGNFFESASGVSLIDSLLQFVQNEKITGNFYLQNSNLIFGLIPPIAATYLELSGKNCDFLDILAYWSGYIYSLASGILIEKTLKKGLIKQTKKFFLQKNYQNGNICVLKIIEMEKTVEEIMKIEKLSKNDPQKLDEYLIILDLLRDLKLTFFENNLETKTNLNIE